MNGQSARARPRGAFLAVVLGLLLLGVAPSPGATQSNPVLGFAVDRLSIETAAGERHEFSVELARTIEQMALGLMFRTELATDSGMLFDLDPPRRVSMWMKNTLIPLDILFLSPKGDIVGIVENAEPMTLTPRRVALPSLDVLEVPGGWCRTHAVSTGDRVELNTARKPSQGRSSP